jgi:hypothetical protein
MIRIGLLFFTLSLVGCGANYHMRPNGPCAAPGASPLADNCPLAETAKK